MSEDLLCRVPRDPRTITSEWLSARLAQGGGLPSGRVASVAVEPAAKWNLAQLARLAVEYDRQAPPAAPRRLFVKIAPSDVPLAEIFPGEFAFYAEAPARSLPLAPCFGAFRDPQAGLTCILLQDLTATHQPTAWPLPPPVPLCELAVGALAGLHAHWWRAGDAAAGAHAAGLNANERQLASYFQALLPAFFDEMGDRLAPERRDLLQRVCDGVPDLKSRRLAAGRPITRVHGDAHFWNFLYPRDLGRHGCVVIDWEDWRDDFGASDLAMMMALHWYPDRRARHEERLLRGYLAALRRHGVSGYGWDDLRADYRLGHLQNVIVPLFQQQAGHAHASWWSHLERWFLAFDDLDCKALL